MRSDTLRNTAWGWRTFVNVIAVLGVLAWFFLVRSASGQPMDAFLIFILGVIGIALLVSFIHLAAAQVEGIAEILDRLDSLSLKEPPPPRPEPLPSIKPSSPH